MYPSPERTPRECEVTQVRRCVWEVLPILYVEIRLIFSSTIIVSVFNYYYSANVFKGVELYFHALLCVLHRGWWPAACSLIHIRGLRASGTVGGTQDPSGRNVKEKRVLAVSDPARCVVTVPTHPSRLPCRPLVIVNTPNTGSWRRIFIYMALPEHSCFITVLGRFRWSGRLLCCQSVGVGLTQCLR